jgi:hypothetical protein
MTRFIHPAFVAASFVMSMALYAPASFGADAVTEKPAREKAASEEAAKEATKDAQDAAEQKAAKDIAAGVQEHQQAAQKVFEQTKKIAQGLSPAQQQHFFILYNNYNMIGTVKMVQGDIGKAVAACGKENPELKEKMDSRYKTWSEAIDPVVKESEGNVNNMVIAQDYAKPEELKDVFKGLDDTRKLANAQIEKTPVTTKDACEYLLNTMDDTQENFVQLLRRTLMSPPPVAPAKDEAKKEGTAPEAEKAKVPEKTEEKTEKKDE